MSQELRTDAPVAFSAEDGPRGCWSIYLDDFSDTQILPEAVAEESIGELSERQATLRHHYVLSDVPRGEEKAVQSQPVNPHLGYQMEGRTTAIRISGLRALEVCSIAFFVLDQWMVALLHLQILAGKLAHMLQLRRPMWCWLHAFWKSFSGPEKVWLPR